MTNNIIRSNIFLDNFKTNIVTLTFVLPLKKEYASNIALLCGVLKRGNKTYGEMDKINAYLEKNYGASFDISTGKSGEMQTLTFTVGYLDDRYAIDGESVAKNVIDLLRCAVFEPITENGGFKQSFFKQEQQNLKDRISALVNDKRVYSLEKCKQTMFRNESYGVYEQGDIETVDKITAASLYEFYQSLLETAMTVVIYAGSKCDTETLLRPVTERLGKTSCKRPRTEIVFSADEVTTVTEEMNVVQSKLNMGFRLGRAAFEDEFARKLFNVIFGSSPTSKLFMNVREKLSLCYYCSSIIDSIKNVMFVYSGIETDNYEKARAEILNQLELMQKGEFTDEEFENAKAYLIDSYVQSYDSNYALSSMELSGILCDNPMPISEQIEAVKSVTRERVVNVANGITLDTVYLLKGIGGNHNAD